MSPGTRPLVRFLVHGAERSGPPIYLLRILRRWAVEDPGFDREVLLARPGELEEAFRAVGPTRTLRLDRRSPERLVERGLSAAGGSSLADRSLSSAIRWRGGRSRPDVTVVNGATAATARMLEALAPTGPVLLIAHELGTGWFHNIDDAARSLLRSRTRSVLAVSRLVEAFLQKHVDFPPSAITVVPPPTYGVGPRTTAAVTSSRRFRVGGAGVTDWRKAPELWLRVAAEVTASRPDLDVGWHWYGGDAPSDRAFWPLRHEVEHLGLGDRVEFHGEVGELLPHLSGLDLFVSTAREDAYPLVCAEAASAGVPIVSFDDTGAAELTQDGICGAAVPYTGTGAMAAEVVALLDDEERRRRLGDAGRRFAETTLDVAVVAPQVAAWIQRSIGS